jgi:hypothetical protein
MLVVCSQPPLPLPLNFKLVAFDLELCRREIGDKKLKRRRRPATLKERKKERKHHDKHQIAFECNT